MADAEDELARTATAAGSSGAERAAPALGASLGRYRIERTLGEGGMGVVHVAFDPDLERRVALKVLRTDDTRGEASQRLLREARAMARLKDPNVVTVHEVGTANGRDYVAMELIEGETLADWLREARRSEPEIIAAFVAAGRGLAAAHAAGLVHRDFKPHNVLRRRDGRIAVTDFGLARGVEAAPAVAFDETVDLHAGKPGDNTQSPLSGLTATGSVLGTPAYMAPEQWSGGVVGPRADQFAFCVALWEAVTGERPFRGATLDELKRDIARGVTALDDAKLPRRLRAALRRGLDPDPERRWPDMDALIAAIARGQRRAPIGRFVVAGAVLAAATLFFVLARSGDRDAAVAAACQPPARDPAAAYAIDDAELAPVFARERDAWLATRQRACREPAERRGLQLACLDGVVARAEVLRRARVGSAGQARAQLGWLVDPEVCTNASPPRLALAPTDDTARSLGFVLDAARAPADFDRSVAAAFADRAGLEPCARAIALGVVVEGASDMPNRRQRGTDAVNAADACGDDWLRAHALLAAAPLEFEVPAVGDKGRAAVQRAKIAVDRAPAVALVARLDALRADVAADDRRWDEAFAASAKAIEGFGKRGMVHQQLGVVEQRCTFYSTRAEVADIEAMRGELAKWKPIADAAHEDERARELALEDAYARLALGDVASAHADLVRLRRAPKPGKPHTQRLEGSVVDAAGKPVAGAEVVAARQLWVDSIGPFSFANDELPLATTDEHGGFALDDAPDTGMVFAQQGGQRAATRIQPNAKVTLALAPTRHLEGKVELNGLPRTKVLVMLAPAGITSGGLYFLIAPVSPAGTFALDGAPTGKLQIGLANTNGFGSDTAFTTLPASRDAMRGIVLEASTSARVLDVIARSTIATPLDAAQVLAVPGRAPIKTVADLYDQYAHGARVLNSFAHPIVGEAAPKSAAGKTRAGDLVAHLSSVPDGELTVCVIGINGDLKDPEVERKLQAHVNELQLSCAIASATDELLVVEAPPQKRWD